MTDLFVTTGLIVWLIVWLIACLWLAVSLVRYCRQLRETRGVHTWAETFQDGFMLFMPVALAAGMAAPILALLFIQPAASPQPVRRNVTELHQQYLVDQPVQSAIQSPSE